MALVTDPDRLVGRSLLGAFPDRGSVIGHKALAFVIPDQRSNAVGSTRGTAHHLPEGRFAVEDPDEPGRWTYWRVESTTVSGSKKELRPWPADVRWAPMRPPYPEGLDFQQRKAWSQEWYDDVYFAWKDEVIEAIAANPQAAADEFARSAPSADLPAPVKKRPKARVRARPVSKKQREVAAQALMAEALRRAGMSERGIAGELGLPKTTTHRRLSGARVADGLAQIFVEAEIARLMASIVGLARVAGPEDLPRLQEQLEKVRRLQLKASGVPAAEAESSDLGVFGPRLAGDDR